MIFEVTCANCGRIMYFTADQNDASKVHFCDEYCERAYWGSQKPLSGKGLR